MAASLLARHLLPLPDRFLEDNLSSAFDCVMFVATPCPLVLLSKKRSRLALCACHPSNGKDTDTPKHQSGKNPQPKGESFASQRAFHEIPSTSVDWDFEWVKYVATGKIEDTKSKPSSLWDKVKSTKFSRRLAVPNWSRSTKDWRFWVATLLVLSMIMAAIQHSSSHIMGSGFI